MKFIKILLLVIALNVSALSVYAAPIRIAGARIVSVLGLAPKRVLSGALPLVKSRIGCLSLAAPFCQNIRPAPSGLQPAQSVDGHRISAYLESSAGTAKLSHIRELVAKIDTQVRSGKPLLNGLEQVFYRLLGESQLSALPVDLSENCLELIGYLSLEQQKEALKKLLGSTDQLTLSEKHLFELVSRENVFDLAPEIFSAPTFLHEVLDTIRAEEAEGRIVGFHGDHQSQHLLRDLFTHLYQAVRADPLPSTFRFVRYDRCTKNLQEEESLAQNIMCSPAPEMYRAELFFYTLSLFAAKKGSSPIEYANDNYDQMSNKGAIPEIQLLFEQLGISKLYTKLAAEGFFVELQKWHRQALGKKGVLVLLSTTPALMQKYSYAAVSGGKRQPYRVYSDVDGSQYTSNSYEIACSMKKFSAKTALEEEHCFIVPGGLANPENARTDDLRVFELFPDLDKSAFAQYEAMRDRIVESVLSALP